MFVAGNKGQKVEILYAKGQMTPSKPFRERFDLIRWDKPVPGAEFTEERLRGDARDNIRNKKNTKS